MEENTGEEQVNAEQPQEQAPVLNACAKCGNTDYEEGYLTKLCTSCRDELARFPIPQWLKISAGAVVLFVLIGLFFISKPLMAAIHLAKANKFMEAHKYSSASKELSEVISVYPNNIEANTKALIAYGYCLNNDSVWYYYAQVADKDIANNDLMNEVTSFMQSYMVILFNDTALASRLKEKQQTSIIDFNQYVKWYTDSMPEDLSAKLYIASLYSDMNMEAQADTILTDIIQRAPNSFTSYISIVPVKRVLGQLNEADKYADKLLQFNSEDGIAYSHKARIALKRKDLKHANEYAKAAYKLQPDKTHSIATLALVSYYNGEKDLTQKYMAKIKEQETKEDGGDISPTFMWVDSVITGKKSL